jgi:NRAMP (natural resistance-associated macrophage protein)-like metal ion transporter
MIAKELKNMWKKIGPGIITGAADDDPSGVVTYSQAGAAHGFNFLWASLVTFPLMSVVQEMCARLGIVTGKGLGALIREHYSKKVLYICVFLLFIANTFNIGANLGAMASAAHLIIPGISVLIFMVVFTAVSLYLQIFVPYEKYVSFIKYLTFSLLAYIVTAFMVTVDWGVVLYHTLVPSFSLGKEEIIILCGILGTTISPYLFFWQPAQEIEEEIKEGRVTISARVHYANKKVMSDMKKDVWIGMFFSNLVMFFIILVCGAVLFPAGIHTISTAGEAAEALRPIAGSGAYFLFAIGIVGTGLLAIPVLAGSSAYALAEAFKKPEGLYQKPSHAKFFYGVIFVSLVLGFLMNFMGIPSMKALLYSAVLNGLVAPVMLFFIVSLADKKSLMREWANTRFQMILGWGVMSLMTFAGVFTLAVLFF